MYRTSWRLMQRSASNGTPLLPLAKRRARVRAWLTPAWCGRRLFFLFPLFPRQQLEERQLERYSFFLLYWYKSTNTDADGGGRSARRRSLAENVFCRAA